MLSTQVDSELVCTSSTLLIPVSSMGLLCLGTPAVTSRHMKSAEMKQVANYLDEGISLVTDIKASMEKEGIDTSFDVR